MKRSVMINNLWNFLLSEEDLYEKNTAEYLLDYIEELGMTPPNYMSNDCCNPPDLRCGWAPEDE